MKDHRFFTTMSLLTLAVVFAGFANFYGPRLIGRAEPAIPIIHLHAAIFASWILIFVAQTLAVITGRIRLHMQIGKVGVALAGVMLVSGFFTTIKAIQLGHRGIPGVEFSTGEGFMLLNFASLFSFVTLVALGWRYRSQPQMHKRFMLMAAVAGLAPPGISRLPLVSGHSPAIAGLVLAFVLSGPVYDWITRGRPHRAYLFSFPFVILILPPVVESLSTTSAWRELAGFLLRSF